MFASSPRVFRRPAAISRKLAGSIAIAAAAAACQSASALEVTAGDYEVYPAGVNILPLYFQHATTRNLYANGDKIASGFAVTSDIGLIRYIRPVELTPSVFLDVNVILPFGEVRGSDNAAFLGKTSGVADLIIGAPVKFLLDPTSRDAFSIGTFVYLPTGKYDAYKPLNLGENRYKLLVQFAYVAHFGPSFALDVVSDVTAFGKNDEYAGTNELKQDARFENQAHLRYNLSPATSLSVGYGVVTGGQTKVNGVDQNDKKNTQYARLTATHFINQTVQLQAQVGADTHVENGTKERARLNLRLTKIF